MFIEYKIKFEKDGLTVSQTILPNSAPAPVSNGKVKELDSPARADSKNPLTSVPADSSSGPGDHPGDNSSGPGDHPGDNSSGPGDHPGDNTSGIPGQAPIFVLGPIVFNNPAQAAAAQPERPADQRPTTSRAKTAGS